MSEDGEATEEPDYKEIFERWVANSTPHYAAIGMVAAHWAYFELLIDDWCLRLADIPHRPGACLTAQIAGSGRKLDAFAAIIDLMGIKEPSADTLEKFAKRTAGLAEQRHRAAAHDPWDLSDPSEPKRLEVTAKKKLRAMWIPVSTEELRHLAGNIKTLTNDFEALAEQALRARASSRQTPPQDEHQS